MLYNSTRNNGVRVSAAKAIAMGISDDGGLFVPESIPVLSKDEFNTLLSLDYKGRAELILKKFLTDFSDEEIASCVQGAYTGSFENERPAPLKNLDGTRYMLELWHGPTAAFKDLALQLLPYLMTASAKKVRGGKQTVILVATSGDTGKAALAGFCDVENTKIIVFYPDNGVSAIQKLQMDSQQGSNVFVSAIKGNFDDAQTGVKRIFTDPAMIKLLAENGMEFSSANSINWGRLVPQIIYYISAYCDLASSGADLSRGFNVVVPTGNFGNILAAYYARRMGAPINRLVCASNANRVLTDFIETGVYDRNRKFYTTYSPSMDILISSNLERMIYELSDRDDGLVARLQSELAASGRYTVSEKLHNSLREIFYAGSADDDKTVATIRDTYEKYDYLCDTHTGVALSVAEEFLEKTGDTRPVVIASTASPYKFSKAVLKAVDETALCDDEFKMVERLHERTGVAVPPPIMSLKDARPRFSNLCPVDDMKDTVINFLLK